MAVINPHPFVVRLAQYALVLCVGLATCVLGCPDSANAEPRRVPVMILALNFSSDGALLASTGTAIRVHDLKTGKLVHEVESQTISRTIAFFRNDNSRFVEAGDDGEIRFWRVGANEPFRILKGHRGGVYALAFSPDGKRFVTAGATSGKRKLTGGDVRLWDAETGAAVRSLELDDGYCFCVAWSRDSCQIVFASNSVAPYDSSKIVVYDVAEWKQLREVSFGPGVAMSLTILPDQKRFLVVGGPPAASDSRRSFGQAWLSAEGSDQADEIDQSKRSRDLTSVTLDSTGERFYTTTKLNVFATGDSGESIGIRCVPCVTLCEIKTGKILWSDAWDNGPSMMGGVLSPDGNLFACCSLRTIQIYDTARHKLVQGIGVGDLNPTSPE
jgi:WD40 repeat protein